MGWGHLRCPRPAQLASRQSDTGHGENAALCTPRRTRAHRDRRQHGHELLIAADEGKLTHGECPPLMVDYLAPSIDTTMSAISNALYLFASHPEQWQLLKDEPGLMPNAINEVVRYEPPLRAFARYVAQQTEIGGVTIPPGARVLVMYASANRDEREWDEPDVFDIRRDAGRQLGFGQGAH